MVHYLYNLNERIMEMNRKELNINRILLPYLGIMVVMCLVLQIVIALRGNGIDLVAGLLTAIVALYYAYSQIVNRKKLNNIRFGRLVHHVIAFVVVNLSFHVHAGYLLISGQQELLDEQWYGVLFAMFIFWGLGFLIHMTASVAMRGYEELEV